jgi:CheY-like chemotaxis protein
VAESAQLELAQRTLDAETASAEKTRLLAAVAHDLRQPMLSAVLHSEVLRQRLEAGDATAVRRQALRMEESVKVLGETLEHLLVAARYDAGSESVEIGPVALVWLFHRLREVFDSQARSKGIELRISEPSTDLFIATNEQALFRILMNLISNGIKFTEPRGAGSGVLVKAHLAGQVCRIVVADTGVGIEQSHLASIWQPFFQVGNEERNRSKGLGLGLYIVQQSIRRLKGHSISVRSSMRRGSRFIVEVPRHEIDGGRTSDGYRSHACDQPIDLRLIAKSLRGRRVILIEDDREAREAIEAQLNEWGVICCSGVEAGEVLRSLTTSDLERLDWIIADFRLPGLRNGVDVIEETRRLLGYDLPAILVSAEVDREKLSALVPSSTTYIQKPFEARELMVALLGNSDLH